MYSVCAPVPEMLLCPVPAAVVANNIHGWLALAVQLSVPPPVFLMLRSCAAGFGPPATPANVSVVGFTDKVGTGAAVTVRGTFTAAAGIVPDAVIFTAPE